MGDFRIILFNKPYGTLSCFSDPEGRETLKEYIDLPDIYSAGRLDYDSEGLLLLTDDGLLIHQLTDPQHHIPKTYLVQVEGPVTEAALERLRGGLEIQGYRTQPCRAEKAPEPGFWPRRKPITPHAPPEWISLTIAEGKKRQIRHMTAAVGLPTLRLVRVAIGPLQLTDLQPGQWRDLSHEEELNLRRLIQQIRSLHAGKKRSPAANRTRNNKRV
ncbi:MAG: pseudouridine synthase [Anaerolineae bacterium]|nr:pseudouridine synthase [Anaerolineae bacterium]